MQLFTFLFFAAINAVYGLMQPQVDNLAHAGGFAGGVLIGMLLLPLRSPRRRAFVLRLVSAGLLVLLAVVAAHLSHNLRHGGYPQRIAAWQTVTAPNGEWSLRVPAVWERVEENDRQVTFEGPLGAVFQVFTSQEPEGPLPPDSVIERTIIRAHGREYEEWVLTADTRVSPTARFAYKIRTERGTYVLFVICEAEMMEAYRLLARRLPLTFKLLNDRGDGAAEAPAGAPPAGAPLSP